MAFKYTKRRWHKITTVALLVLASTILVLAFLVNRYWSPVLANKVKEVVSKSSNGLYTINFSSAEFHVIRGSIVFFNITFKPDTAIYNREKKQHLAPNNLVELHVKRLTLSHIHPFMLYFYHKLDIDEITLNNPELNISYQLNHTKDTILKDNRTAWQKISKSLRSVHIGSILLGDVKFKYEDYSGNKVVISELKEMDLSARDLLIDSATQTDKSRLLYCKDIIVELNNYAGKTSSGLYSYKIKSLKLSTLKLQLNVTGLTLKPVGTEKFFNNSPNERFSLRLDSLQLNHFDFLNYHKYRILSASSMVLNGGDIQIFANPINHTDSSNRVKTFPNVALYKINSDMKIDTILVHHINVLYSEFNIKSKEIGSISFNNTSGSILNVTTNKTALQKNNISTAQLTSYFMNRGKFNVTLVFNLTDTENTFSYKGTLGPMDLKFANPATMPLGMVKITSGTLRQFSFDIQANRNNDRGRVELLYNNVKVGILTPDTNFNNLRKKPIASMFANLYIIKHNNPDTPGGVPRSFYVNYTRKKETPFFKSIWQTLFSGIKPCAGFDEQTQQAVIEMKNQQVIKKQNRKIKKEERIKRRTERQKKRELKNLLKSKEISS